MRHFLLAAALLLCSLPARAANYIVSNTNDAGTGSLRAAIVSANNAASDDNISFSVTGTIGLFSTLPAIAAASTGGSLTIAGPTGGTVTSGIVISGDANYSRVNDAGDVQLLVVDTGANLTLQNLSLSGGRATNGGAILNNGTLTLTNCFVSGSTATNFGGAIRNTRDLTMTGSTVSGNSAVNGAGVYSSFNLSMTNCTVSGNAASHDGGGIYLLSGGANTGTTLNSLTIAGNTATDRGGGIANINGVLTLNNSIVAVNSATTLPTSANILGTMSGGSNLTSGSPLLDVLRDNGGPTPTRALLANSRAIDAGASNETTDQRGFKRPIDLPTANAQGGNGSDIGAFELNEAPQSGPNFVVNAMGDGNDGACGPNDCSLREAINAANANPNPNTITFAANVRGLIQLADHLPDITTPVSIQGPGAGALAVAGAVPTAASRVVYGVLLVARSGSVNVAGLTFTQAFGAIFNSGALTLSDCTLSRNQSAVVNAATGTATLLRCLLSVNSGADSGSAIYNAGMISLSNCVLSNNTAVFSGGAISNTTGGTATLNDCVLSGNRSLFNGGAIVNSGTLAVNNSTLTGNSISSAGGALSNFSGTATLSNCTLSGNEARSGNGGAISNSANLTVSACTITANKTAGSGALNNGSVNGGGGGALALSNTLVAGNTGNAAPDLSGTAQSGDYNLIGNASGAILAGTHNLININPNLDPDGLKDNGGPTPTIALVAVSPAINAGDPNIVSGVDQRGLPRVRGGRVDIGAFEVQNDAPVLANIALSANEDTPLALSAAIFDASFSDDGADPDQAQSVRIDTLPANGALTLSGVAVTAGQVVARADLNALTFTPAANFNGATSFGYNASDGTLFAATGATVTITLQSVNDAPTLDAIADVTFGEDAGAQTVQLSGISAGGGETQTLSVTATSDNTALIPDPTVTYTSAQTTGSLSFAPIANQNGAATITVTVSDGIDRFSRAFTVSVSASNDAPTISNLADVTTDEDTSTAPIAFTVGDVETGAGDLTLTATSSDTTLVPVASIVFGGSGANRSVTVMPAPDQNGAATITVTVSDGTATSSSAFVLTINAVNDAPVAQNQTAVVNENGSVEINLLSGATDAEGDALTVENIINDQTSRGSVTHMGGGSVTYYPAPHFNGSASFSYDLSDGKATSNRATVNITVNAVNDAPQNISLAPTDAVNAPDEIRTFAATYSDVDGVGDLAQVYIRFSANNRSTNALIARYDVAQDKLFLLNDDTSQFVGGFAPGSANIVSNSQGKFLINRTLVTRTANTLSVTWTFKAKGKPAGLKLNIGLRAEDTLGLSVPVTPSQPAPRAFASFGTWTIQPNRAPSNVSVTPVQASAAPNQERLFAATYSDPDGFKNLSQVRLRIKGTNSKSLADDLVGVYNVQSNELFLVNDRGNGFVRAQGVRPGTGSVLTNTRGSLNPRATTVTRSGNTLTIGWALSASSNFLGTHPVQLFCIDMGGLKDDYETLGRFSVGASAGVAARSSVSTTSAVGNGVTLVFAGVAPQSGYAIAVNGASVEVTSASVKGGKVSLLLAQTLVAGDQVAVTWPGGSTMVVAG